DRGRVVQQSTAIFEVDARPLLRAVSTGWYLRAGNPAAPREQQLRLHSDDGRARGLSWTPLAPGDGEEQSQSEPPYAAHAVSHRGLGPVRRARDARAGLLY